jgi:DNA repair exonuclease SbcCD nuclease subunit
MKIAIVNDTHAGARQESLHFNSYFFKFWDDIFFPYLDTHNIQHVLHLGDLVDRRKFMNYVIMNSWRTKFFDKLENARFLVGNHDVPYRNTNTPNAISELIEDRYDFPVHISPQEVYYDELLVGVVPWINSSNAQESLDFIKNTKAKVLFGHFEIAGFEMDKGHVCDTGLDRTIFDKFEKVISGHFHTKSNDGSIYYLGSQYEMTWADYGDKKGFHIFDTDTLDLEFIHNPNQMFHKVWYDDSKQDFNYWKSQDLTRFKDSYVKVIVSEKNNSFLFDRVIEMIGQVNPVDIMVAEDYGKIYEESAELIDEAEDTPTIIHKYIDGLTLPPEISSDKLKKLTRDLYTEALGMESQQASSSSKE